MRLLTRLYGNLCPGGTKLDLINNPGGVVMFLIMSWGKSDLINDCLGGMVAS